MQAARYYYKLMNTTFFDTHPLCSVAQMMSSQLTLSVGVDVFKSPTKIEDIRCEVPKTALLQELAGMKCATQFLMHSLDHSEICSPKKRNVK